MDEQAKSRWRDMLLSTLARRVRGWAENVLSEPSAPQEPSAAPPAGMRSEPTGIPPIHWLRDVQRLRAGPPADWMERVQKGAPHLLRSLPKPVAPRLPTTVGAAG